MVMLEAVRISKSSAPAPPPRNREGGFGTQRSSQISTWAHERAGPDGAVEQIDAERRAATGDLNAPPDHKGAGGEPAVLVELAIVRQEGLGGDADDLAPVDHHRAVVEEAVLAERRADHEQRIQGLGLRAQAVDLVLHRVQQRLLKMQVVDGVGRQAKLWEHQDGGVLLVRAAHHGRDRVGVGGGIGGGDAGGADAHPHELVGVGRVERKRGAHGANGSCGEGVAAHDLYFI